ncbi:MAG: His-Xaa-Ser system radical SAM maturase HxsC [Proteobacteria bacterium]|nr:MAG: His-Xaa-Ser system radical SAM maturase HxsC [Pseudomonadota bacterium]
MRRVRARFGHGFDRRVRRVTNLTTLASEWAPDLNFAVLVKLERERTEVSHLQTSRLENVQWIESDVLQVGDIVVPANNSSEVLVLHRDSDRHHALQLTNRCNSLCLMCSQPPTRQNDSWMVDEALDIVRHFRTSPRCIGLTGGEPFLLRKTLRSVIDFIATRHPDTHIEVLTNGRLLADTHVVQQVLQGLQANVSWLVPLYGHADFLHDYVVQTHGAFDETIAGLLNLQLHCQPIQLRIVLIEPVLRSLPDLCAFIGRNLPFVREVALMACEPTGFAIANRETCQVDLRQYAKIIAQSARILNRYAVPYVLMNTPLCVLPRSLWPAASQSISDWKNVYSDACTQCTVKARCSGLFAWHEAGWVPAELRPVLEIET